MKRFSLSVLAVCLAVLCCACSGGSLFNPNVEDLLRAPQPSGVQSDVQSALNAYTGTTVHLKYPRGGDELLPIQVADFDGDGKKEAAVLYSMGGEGQNVWLAMLEEAGDGWRVSDAAEGLSTEVAELVMCGVSGSGLQLAVGYANSTLTTKFLSVYSYDGTLLLSMLEGAYSQFTFAPLTKTGAEDLVMLPTTVNPGALTLQLYSQANTRMELVQTVQLDSRFTQCMGLYPTQWTGARGIVVDAAFTTTGNLSSQTFVLQNELLTETASTLDIPLAVMRFKQELTSRDINGDGAVETPFIKKSITTLSGARRFYVLQWNNYLKEEPFTQYGVYDAGFGFYVRLPNEWLDDFLITDAPAANAWQVRRRSDNSLYMTVAITDTALPDGNAVVAAVINGKKIRISFTGQVAISQKNIITRSVTAIEQ